MSGAAGSRSQSSTLAVTGLETLQVAHLVLDSSLHSLRELTFLLRKEEVYLFLLHRGNKIALASSEGRQIQRNSVICLIDLKGRDQKWGCGSESY